MIQYLIEMTVWDPIRQGERILYFSTHGYTTPPTGTPANQHYARRIQQPGNYELSMFQAGKTSGESRVGFGEVILSNPDGALDYLLDYGLDGRAIVFKRVSADGTVTTLASCSMEQPEFTDEQISIRIKDPQAIFNGALQPVKYAGTNVRPGGVEGGDDIKGKPKPLTFGPVYNVTPVQVNTSKLIYQLHDSSVFIPAVYDKGVGLLRGADYVDRADMEAHAPGPGVFRCWAAGGCFRLGSSPSGQVTADAVEGATAADRTAAQVAKRIALRVLGSSRISAADISALDAANPAEVGIYVAEESTVMAALDQVLGSVGAWYGFDANLVLRMQRFTEPSGTPAFTLTAAKWKSIERIASNDAGRGVPVWQVNLSYQKNWTVQTSDLAGSVQSVYAKLKWSAPKSLPRWISYNRSIAYGNGVFVGISGGNILVSPDGMDLWDSIILAGEAGSYPQAITFGDGHFLAISSIYAYTSTDGRAWYGWNFPEPNCRAVAYGNGLFVAIIGNSSHAYTSPDGITWTLRTLPASAEWYSVVWGDAGFVATSIGSMAMLNSADGVTWVQQTAPSVSTSLISVAFGNGYYVALPYNYGTAYISADGRNWSPVTLPATDSWYNIAFGGGYFVATSTNSISLVSADGLNWVVKDLGEAFNFNSICYGNGMFICARYQTEQVFRLVINPDNSRKNWLAAEYRTVTVSAPSVKSAHLLAPELNVTTLLAAQSAAQQEVERLLELYRVRRDTLQVGVDTQELQYVEIGKVGKLFYDRYGYSAGKLFRVIGVTPDWGTDTVTLTLWG